MITTEELKIFLEYINKESYSIGINIPTNQMESSLIWYSRTLPSEEVHIVYGICLTLRTVTHYNGTVINKDIKDFLNTMQELEHQFCINNLGTDEYSFFDYATDIWRVKDER